jgi:cell division protein FtsB
MSENITITKNGIGILLAILTLLSIFASSVIAYTITNQVTLQNQDEIRTIKEDVRQVNSQITELKTQTAIISLMADDIKDIKQDIKYITRGKE